MEKLLEKYIDAIKEKFDVECEVYKLFKDAIKKYNDSMHISVEYKNLEEEKVYIRFGIDTNCVIFDYQIVAFDDDYIGRFSYLQEINNDFRKDYYMQIEDSQYEKRWKLI